MNSSESGKMEPMSTSLLESQFNCRPLRGHCVYFIGIGGIGMSAVARILINEGCIVSGSDLRISPLTSSLEGLGAKINTKQDGSFMSSETDIRFRRVIRPPLHFQDVFGKKHIRMRFGFALHQIRAQIRAGC